MILLDSNIIIYSYANYPYLREVLIQENTLISEITKVEVLGYHKLSIDEENYFRSVFTLLPSISVDHTIIEAAINIRKKFNLKLGDSLIAGTAFTHNLTLYTRNLSDFERIEGLTTKNPIKE